jgi:hypothetical protein
MNESQLLGRITVNPAIFGGKPIIRGRRLAVEHVLAMLAAGGVSGCGPADAGGNPSPHDRSARLGRHRPRPVVDLLHAFTDRRNSTLLTCLGFALTSH